MTVLTLDELKQTQMTLETLAKNEIDEPMTNMIKLKRLLKVIDEVDTLRRETWNTETFGETDNVAAIFCSDDIPF